MALNLALVALLVVCGLGISLFTRRWLSTFRRQHGVS